MKKLFTLFAMLVVAVSASAQLTAVTDKTWNFSDWDAGDITATTIIDNLEVAAAADATVTVDNNSKSIDDFNFTRRIKMGGTGKAESRNLHFKVAGNCDITVYGMSASSSETRTLNIDTGSFGNNVATFENDGKAIGKVEYSYKGGEADVYVYSQKSGFNIYGIVVKQNVDDTPTEKEYTINITSDPESNYNSGEYDLDIAEVAAALGTDQAGLFALLDGNQSFFIDTADGTKSNATSGNPGENAFWMDGNGYNVGYGTETTRWYAGIYYDAGSTGHPADVNEDKSIDINDVVCIINKMAGTAEWAKSDVNADERTDINDVVAVINAMAAGASAEPSDPRLFIRVGQTPNYFSKIYEDTDLSTVVYLITGNKSVKFNVNLHVNAAEEPVAVLLPNLNIVKDYEITMKYITNRATDHTDSLDVSDIYEALGTTAEELDANVSNATVYAQQVKTEVVNDENFYSLTDTLFTLNDFGFDGWFGRYVNWVEEGGGKEVPLEINGPKGWGSSATYYIHDIALADGKFTLYTGQYSGTMAAGDTDYTYIYIVKGTNAARIKLQANVEDPEYIDPKDMVLAGETTIEVTAEINNEYATKPFTVDMATVCEALGCTTDDFDDVYSWDQSENMSDNHTEGSGGFYFNEAGRIENWGSNSAFFIARTNSSLSDGGFTIGQMSGHFTDITEPVTVTGDLIFKHSTKYYVVHVAYTVKPASENTDNPEDAFNIVSRQALEMEIVPSANYYVSEPAEVKEQMQLHLDMTDVATLIGEGTYTFYGLRAPAAAGGYPTLTTSTGYGTNTGFNGGFWMAMPNAELDEEYRVYSFVGSWGTNSYGIEWNLSNGTIGFDQIPNQRAIGDEFTSIFYLVNEGNDNKAIKYTLDVRYVESVSPAVAEVGKVQAGVTITDENIDSEGLYEGAVGVDWAAVCKALGIDESEIADCSWMYSSPSGKLTNCTSGFEGENYMFDENGLYVSEDNFDKAVFALGFNYEAKAFTVSFLGADPTPGATYKTNCALKSETGYYVFEVTITVPEE